MSAGKPSMNSQKQKINRYKSLPSLSLPPPPF